MAMLPLPCIGVTLRNLDVGIDNFNVVNDDENPSTTFSVYLAAHTFKVVSLPVSSSSSSTPAVTGTSPSN